MKYIGTARSVMELVKLLDNIHGSASIELKGTDDSWAYIEVWYILLSMVVQQLLAILVFLQQKVSTCPSTPPSWN